MAGRPRTITDERILAAVATAVGRVGPVRLTLADVARDAGVSTGLLVRRYGTKRGLLLAFSGQGGAFVERMRAAYDAAPDPVEGLIRSVTPDQESSPEAFANHLAFLHLELADEEFHALLGEHATRVRAELTRYVTEAAERGLLRTADIPALAAAIDAVRNGSQLTWAMHRAGTLAGTLRRDLETLLAPYRPPGPPPAEQGSRQPTAEQGSRQPTAEQGPRQPTAEQGPRPADPAAVEPDRSSNGAPQ